MLRLRAASEYHVLRQGQFDTSLERQEEFVLTSL